MGTNYYWHDQPCEHCGRFETIHICKSLHTWCAYRTLLNADHPEWGPDEVSPFGFDVVSLEDWRRVLAERPGYVQDEYGRRHDSAGFFDDALPWKPDQWEGRKYLDKDIREDRGWLDAGGFRFYVGEFS